MDRSIVAARLATLEAEYSSGQRMLADYESKAQALRDQLLRIGGAIRVLSELLQEGGMAAQVEPAGVGAQLPPAASS